MNEPKQDVVNSLPPGYQALVPFEKQRFPLMGRAASGRAHFVAHLNSVLVLLPEFFHAARHYPLVFGRDTSGAFIPVCVTGLEDRQNLFVDEEGYWRRESYLPAYVRRWPFFTVPLAENPDKSLICVDPAGLENNDTPFIDANGEPTDAWREMERMIQDVENARRATLAFGRQLAELDLIESFEAHAMAPDGRKLRLGNMHRVSEQRLNKLPDKQVRVLMNRGYLSRIYAHLFSLENFQRLLDLRLERQPAAGQA